MRSTNKRILDDYEARIKDPNTTEEEKIDYLLKVSSMCNEDMRNNKPIRCIWQGMPGRLWNIPRDWTSKELQRQLKKIFNVSEPHTFFIDHEPITEQSPTVGDAVSRSARPDQVHTIRYQLDHDYTVWVSLLQKRGTSWQPINPDHKDGHPMSVRTTATQVLEFFGFRPKAHFLEYGDRTINKGLLDIMPTPNTLLVLRIRERARGRGNLREFIVKKGSHQCDLDKEFDHYITRTSTHEFNGDPTDVGFCDRCQKPMLLNSAQGFWICTHCSATEPTDPDNSIKGVPYKTKLSFAKGSYKRM